MTPIEIFNSQEELNLSLKEWQERLFLSDWIIKAILVDKCSDNEYGTTGLNTRLPVQRTALIEILKTSSHIEENHVQIAKQPHELILVHELLHCKKAFIQERDNSYEHSLAEYYEHALLEEIAKF